MNEDCIILSVKSLSTTRTPVVEIFKSLSIFLSINASVSLTKYAISVVDIVLINVVISPVS